MQSRKFYISLLLIAFLTISIATGSQPRKFQLEKCGDCHSDSPAYKEWQTSGHAKALNTLLKDKNAGRSCLKCHSSDFDRVRLNAWMSARELPTPETAGNAVSCSSCHKHESGREKNLIMPLEKLCVTCHVLYCGG